MIAQALPPTVEKENCWNTMLALLALDDRRAAIIHWSIKQIEKRRVDFVIRGHVGVFLNPKPGDDKCFLDKISRGSTPAHGSERRPALCALLHFVMADDIPCAVTTHINHPNVRLSMLYFTCKRQGFR